MDLGAYIRQRAGLPHLKKALEKGKLTIGFLGGSITEPADGKRWSDKIVDWFALNYPEVTLNVENAAKGATGSLSAVFRMDTDLMVYDCDIVFVETAVNDGPGAWGACREGMIRKLLKEDRFDVIIMYTYCQSFYDDFLAERLTPSIADWEELAEHYGISSAFGGQYAFDLTTKGYLRWEEWLPDGLHPAHAGSRYYAEVAAKLIEGALKADEKPRAALPAPIHANAWSGAHLFPLEQVRRIGPWRLVHARRFPSVDYILTTTSVRAALSFTFEGRGLLIRENVNSLHSAYRYRIDGGEWVDKTDPLPDWGKNATDWIREELLTDTLELGTHTVEIEPVFAAGGAGSLFELTDIGIIM